MALELEIGLGLLGRTEVEVELELELVELGRGTPLAGSPPTSVAMVLAASSDGLSIVSAKKMLVSLPARMGSWVLNSRSRTIAFSP